MMSIGIIIYRERVFLYFAIISRYNIYNLPKIKLIYYILYYIMFYKGYLYTFGNQSNIFENLWQSLEMSINLWESLSSS